MLESEKTYLKETVLFRGIITLLLFAPSIYYLSRYGICPKTIWYIIFPALYWLIVLIRIQNDVEGGCLVIVITALVLILVPGCELVKEKRDQRLQQIKKNNEIYGK
jgi:hypothetical protein